MENLLGTMHVAIVHTHNIKWIDNLNIREKQNRNQCNCEIKYTISANIAERVCIFNEESKITKQILRRMCAAAASVHMTSAHIVTEVATFFIHNMYNTMSNAPIIQLVSSMQWIAQDFYRYTRVSFHRERRTFWHRLENYRFFTFSRQNTLPVGFEYEKKKQNNRCGRK